jgi:hypothetical protein
MNIGFATRTLKLALWSLAVVAGFAFPAAANGSPTCWDACPQCDQCQALVFCESTAGGYNCYMGKSCC